MKKLTNLKNVNALALPAKILVAMSKYARTLEETNGDVIRLSSLNVFNDIHSTCLKAKDQSLNKQYYEILDLANMYIESGVMFTNQKKKKIIGKKSIKERVLKKYTKQNSTTNIL